MHGSCALSVILIISMNIGRINQWIMTTTRAYPIGDEIFGFGCTIENRERKR